MFRCVTFSTSEPRLQLLGGFAGRTGPKHRNTPAFSQVGEANSEQTPPETGQKSRTHGKTGAHFLRNRPEPAGSATTSEASAAVSADAAAHPTSQGPARRQGHSNRQRRQRMGLPPLLGRIPAQRVATSPSAFAHIDDQHANHRNPPPWSLLPGIQPRAQERTIACQERSACRRRIIHHAPAEPFQ